MILSSQLRIKAKELLWRVKWVKHLLNRSVRRDVASNLSVIRNASYRPLIADNWYFVRSLDLARCGVFALYFNSFKRNQFFEMVFVGLQASIVDTNLQRRTVTCSFVWFSSWQPVIAVMINKILSSVVVARLVDLGVRRLGCIH